MDLELVKQIIIDVEGSIEELQYYIEQYAGHEERPTHILNMIKIQEREKEKLKGLKVKLSEMQQPKKVGRPSKGITKKVSITMPVEFWGIIDTIMQDNCCSQSEAFRFIVDWYKDS